MELLAGRLQIIAPVLLVSLVDALGNVRSPKSSPSPKGLQLLEEVGDLTVVGFEFSNASFV